MTDQDGLPSLCQFDGHAGSRMGEGGTSVDPYLLRVVEAANVDLVAGSRLHKGVRLSAVYGGDPSPVRRMETEPCDD